MSGLLRPGDARAGDLFTDAALRRRDGAGRGGLAGGTGRGRHRPGGRAHDLAALVDPGLTHAVAERHRGRRQPGRTAGRAAARATRGPRGRRRRDLAAPGPDQPGRARHRPDALRPGHRRPAARRPAHARWPTWPNWPRTHRATPMVARTLTQPAVPYTFGAKVASWLPACSTPPRTWSRVDRDLPGQFGGAAGTLAAPVELLAATGADDPPAAALALAERTAATPGPGRPRPVAHRPRAGHPAGRGLDRRQRRAGPHRQRRAGAGPPRDSASWPNRPDGAGRRPCRRRPIPCCRC